jgi:putative phosphoesterase
MRIAVIADTHNRYPRGLPQRLRTADEIWHLGDVCEPDTLAEFEQLGRPLRVVLGNNDSHFAWPIALELEREGLKFYLTHVPPNRKPVGFHVVLHGHTHVPRDEVACGIRWLNPGCISHPRRGLPPSFAWLEVAGGKLADWKLVSL